MDCLDLALGMCPSCMGQHTPNGKTGKATITSIAEVNGKVLVTLDNGSYLEADMSAVDRNLNANILAVGDMQDLKDRIARLELSINNIENKFLNLITIESLSGEAFKAFPLNT